MGIGTHSDVVVRSQRGQEQDADGSVAVPAASPGGSGTLARRILDRLEASLAPGEFARCFAYRLRVEVRGSCLDVCVPTGFVAELVERRYEAAWRQAAAHELGIAPEAVSLRVRVDRSGGCAGLANGMAVPPSNGSARPEGTCGALGNVPVPTCRRGDDSLRYRLEDFVVGESNRLAFHAAQRLAEPGARAGQESAPPFGMLFIHGSCGLGKTHLLQGMAWRYRERRPGASVRYMCTETLVNEFVSAVRRGRLEAFRAAFRRFELLCLDDVQFLANKHATQTELLHTLDALASAGARVALASDQPPQRVRHLSAALVSRFAGGMVVELRTPEPALRERIAAVLAQRRGLTLDPAGVRAIAAHAAGGSVRDIEGALTRIEAMWRIAGQAGPGANGTVGLVTVRKALGVEPDSAYAGTVDPVPMAAIIAAVCGTLGVEPPELSGRGRHPRVVLARALVGHLARHMTTLSFPEIARAMGKPGHSAIVAACQRLASQLERDVPLKTWPGLPETFAGLTLRDLVQRLRAEATRRAAASRTRSVRSGHS